jgi:hypothetical protein
MRGGRKPSAAGQKMVGIAGVGPSGRQAVEHAVRDRRLGAQAASILHRMWLSETAFHVGFCAKVTQRLRLKPVQ